MQSSARDSKRRLTFTQHLHISLGDTQSLAYIGFGAEENVYIYILTMANRAPRDKLVASAVNCFDPRVRDCVFSCAKMPQKGCAMYIYVSTTRAYTICDCDAHAAMCGRSGRARATSAPRSTPKRVCQINASPIGNHQRRRTQFIVHTLFV